MTFFIYFDGFPNKFDFVIFFFEKRNCKGALPLFIKCFQIKVFVEHSRFLFFIKSLLYI